jgi:hypothetical protein
MGKPAVLAVVQKDLQLNVRLRTLAARLSFNLLITRSAQEATLYLRGIGVYQNRINFPLPGLVVLDCENQDASDLKLLSWIRETNPFQRLPVVLLTQEPPHNVHLICALDPVSFMVDRNDLSGLRELIKSSCVAAESPGRP